MLVHRLLAVLLASTVLTVAAAPSALAADKVQRLRDGCFNASYRDGFASTTIYFRNACKKARKVKIHWKGGTSEVRSVRGHGKGHSRRFHGSSPTITDLGRI